ncbi:MAG: hypothetical protein JW795_07205 [Chitinivibrionales bacterium]|nr:hypothetical protein [Chitinivibrionales bacterium]
MAKFSIAFITPQQKNQLKHRIVEGPDQETALRSFYNDELTEFYSDDDQGYHYFKEDFFDSENPGGSIIVCEHA